MPEAIHDLDALTLELFASKGLEGARGIPLGAGEANAARVRRVIQATCDLSRTPIGQIRILDLACGEGVFAIEAALRGAQVVALDARTVRMSEGKKAAERLGISNLRFDQSDVREVTVESYGQFDVVYAMGILYHLDIDDNFKVIRNIYETCRQFVVIDTSVVEEGASVVSYNGGSCSGQRVREHENDDSASDRRKRPLASLDNTYSFLFTKRSLCRALKDAGFTSVLECQVPLEPTKPASRVTLIAIKGEAARISAYPWINDKSEDEISSFLSEYDEKIRAKYSVGAEAGEEGSGGRSFARKMVRSFSNGILRPFGLEIRRRPKR